MIDALEPCPDCGSMKHKSCEPVPERPKQTEREEYELSPEDIEFNRVMALYCGDDFTMQAGFQRAWLYLKVHEVTACNNYEALKQSHAALFIQLQSIFQQVTNGRVCYFGDHTGYEPQFSTTQTCQWEEALANAKKITEGL